MDPILRCLNHVASKGFFISSSFVFWHREGTVLRIKTLGCPEEDEPFLWAQLPKVPWEVAEAWVHEAAWRSGAPEWKRWEHKRAFSLDQVAISYGPAARKALGVKRHLIWLFRPSAWLHPTLLQIPLFRRLARPLDDLPDHQPDLAIKRRTFRCRRSPG